MRLNNNPTICRVECFSHTLCLHAYPSFWVLAVVLLYYAWDHPPQRDSRPHHYYSSNPEFHHIPTSLFSYSEVCYCSGALIPVCICLVFSDSVHRTSYTHTELLRHSSPHKSIQWRNTYSNSGHGHASLMDSEVCCLPLCIASMLSRDHCHLFEHSPHTPFHHIASPHSCALSRPAPASRLNKHAAVFFSDLDFFVLLLVHPVTTCVYAKYVSEYSDLHASLLPSSEVCWCSLAPLLLHHTNLGVINWVNAYSRVTNHVSPSPRIHTTRRLFFPALRTLSVTLHSHLAPSHTPVLPTTRGPAPTHTLLSVFLLHLRDGTDLHFSLCTSSEVCWRSFVASSHEFCGGESPIVQCDASPQIFHGLRACEVGLHPPHCGTRNLHLPCEQSSCGRTGAHLWCHSCTPSVCLLVQSLKSTLRYVFLHWWGDRYTHSGAFSIINREVCNCHHQPLRTPRSSCSDEFEIYTPNAHCRVSAHSPPRLWRHHSVRVTLDLPLRLNTECNSYTPPAIYSGPLLSLGWRNKVCRRLLQGPCPEFCPQARVRWRVSRSGCTNMASHTLRAPMPYPPLMFLTQAHQGLDRIHGVPRTAHHMTRRCTMHPNFPCDVLSLHYPPWPVPAFCPVSLPSPPVPFKRLSRRNRS